MGASIASGIAAGDVIIFPQRGAVAVYERALAVACRHFGVPVDEARVPRGGRHRANQHRRPRAGLARQVALYLAVCEAGVMQAAVARAAGITRPSLHRTLRLVEDWRDDARFDGVLERLAVALAGGDIRQEVAA